MTRVMFKAFLYIAFLIPKLAGGATITGGNSVYIYEDVFLSPQSVIDADKIYVDNAATIINHGKIHGDIIVADETDVVIQNCGSITGEIIVGHDATLTQMITSADDLRQINVWGDYTIRVRGNENLNLADIQRIGAFANEIILDNATIVIDGPTGIRLLRRRVPDIKLVGEITVDVDADMVADGDILMSGVSGDGAVLVHVSGLDTLFTASIRNSSGNLYLNIIRETDYLKILDPRRGVFMNTIREMMPDDKLVHAMDTAQSRDELEQLMARSVRFNPINLMQVAKIFNMFHLAADDVADGFDLRYDRIFNNHLDMPGLTIGLGAKFGPLSVGISAYAALMDYADDLNEFSGTMLGADIRAMMDFDIFWMRGVFGMSVTEFDVGPVLGADDIYINPRGRSSYAMIDAGIRMKSGNFYVIPFVGLMGNDNTIAGLNNHEITPRGGMRMGYAYDMDGLRYDIEFHGTLTRDSIVVGTRLGINSIWDGIGGELSADALHNDIGTSYKVSVRGTCDF